MNLGKCFDAWVGTASPPRVPNTGLQNRLVSEGHTLMSTLVDISETNGQGQTEQRGWPGGVGSVCAKWREEMGRDTQKRAAFVRGRCYDLLSQMN